MRLLLARHGHATSGPDHRWTADDPLTELGHVQAQELGQHVAGLAARPDRIIASTAIRSLDTARACAAALDLQIATDARLIEFGSGAPTPYTLAEMFETQPYDDIWHPDDPAHDGEPVGAFHRRVAEAADEIWAGGGAPLVVSHGGTTNALLRWALGIPPEEPDMFGFSLPNASLTAVGLRIDRHGRRRTWIERVGDVRFLTRVTAI